MKLKNKSAWFFKLVIIYLIKIYIFKKQTKVKVLKNPLVLYVITDKSISCKLN